MGRSETGTKYVDNDLFYPFCQISLCINLYEKGVRVATPQ